MGSVRKITKEKTAKIIPNAIGVTTNEGKKIFGSLMARDVVYRLAVSVWKKYHFPGGGSFSSGEKVTHHKKPSRAIQVQDPIRHPFFPPLHRNMKDPRRMGSNPAMSPILSTLPMD